MNEPKKVFSLRIDPEVLRKIRTLVMNKKKTGRLKMSIKIVPSVKAGRGYIGLSLDIPARKVTIKNEDFLVTYEEKTGKISVNDLDGKNVGEGELKKNEKKKTEKSPDHVGFIRIHTDEYELIAYSQSSLSLMIFQDKPEGGEAG